MSTSKPKILIVDDEEDLRETLSTILKKKYQPLAASNGAEALKFLDKESVSLVLLDIRMPGGLNGIETLKKIKEKEPALEVIMLTASRDVADAVEAMKLGAADYLNKPFDTKELLLVIEKTLEKTQLRQENLYLKDALESYSYGDLIGKSAAIKKVFSMIEKVADTSSTILIQGESGTGKEVVARTIHQKSSRKNKPYVAVNCAAIPETLLESEMFGHERGSFTGAVERKIGKFELASNGTLFLDEVGCMSPGMQAKLLRVLEDKTIHRVGGEAGVAVDVRIIAATNLDFEKAMKDGSFRQDLYYRLNVIAMNLPPLRERREDIPLFIQYFLDKYNRDLNKKIRGFTPAALNAVQNYQWPGNVRELQNLIERAVVLSSGDDIGIEELPFSVDKFSLSASDKLLPEAVDDFEREYIKRVLTQCAGNRTQAARTLGINRTTLMAKISSLGLS